jgi:GT2 family glycosyltransferase/glycosyltransferase involved in cell wall biosynthesis
MTFDARTVPQQRRLMRKTLKKTAPEVLAEMAGAATAKRLRPKKSVPPPSTEAQDLHHQISSLKKDKHDLDQRVAELHKENERLSRQVFVLNKSLIAQSNYATSAVVMTARTAPRAIESSLLQEMAWFLRWTISVGPKRALNNFRTYLLLKDRQNFDADYYADQADVKGLSPAKRLRHYVSEGYLNGFDPSPAFSIKKYFDFYPDVQASGVEPYSHYLLNGERERRIAMPSDARKSIAGDSIMRIYDRGFASKPQTSSAAAAPEETQEERKTYDWPLKRQPGGDRRAFGLYDIRPEDEVIVEGAAGEAFLDRFALLSQKPDFAGAVAYLNAMTPASRVVTDADEAVDASIVIPVYGQLGYTLNCLHALLLHTSRYSFEILVGDDVSPDESGTWLPQIKAIQYIRYKVNGGFIDNCNLTAAQGHGRYMVMLNNDTRVVSGWLDHMLDAFKTFPKAGLIGSKLFYPDGLLQEAGGIIWQDGSGWNYGRGDDPNRPRYSYARQVDYISGCSIAIPTPVWKAMKGFDPHYRPAYCEDVDLCFRLRKAGYETWFQPLSRIIHYEGKTSGTDTGQGVKAYQVANTAKLFKRWKDTLADHRPNADSPWLERERKIGKRVLVIDACNPTPRQDAGSVSIINLFRYYQALDYQVSFVPEDNFLYQPEEVSEMQAMGVQCFYAPYELYMPVLLQRYGSLFDIIHVIRAQVATKCVDLIKEYAPHAKLIYQNSDLHYLRMQRQAAVEGKPELLAAAEEMKVKELNITRTFNVTIVHSDVERELLQAELPGAKVMVMPLIETVMESSAPFDGRNDLMFLGGYSHPPNVDAATWILSDIWPTLSKRLPNARLLLAGARPPQAILAQASDRVVVTGLVPDLAPWFDRTRLFLAALRYGAGSKGKVLSSMAHGVPVIGTDIALEGLPLEEGVTGFTANTAEEIIEKTIELYQADEADWDKLSDAAKSYIVRHHGFEAGVVLLQKAIAL